MLSLVKEQERDVELAYVFPGGVPSIAGRGRGNGRRAHPVYAKPDLTCCVPQPNRGRLQAPVFALHFGTIAVGAPNVVAQFIPSLPN